MKKTLIKMIKPLYLGMPILDISKKLMHEFWYDYIQSKYGDRAKLCYTDTDSFVIYIKSKDFFEDSSNDVERWFDTSNYDENDRRPLLIGKNQKIYGLFKDELRGKIITEVVGLRAKTYAYLIDSYGDGGDDDDDDDDYEKNTIRKKKAKGTQKCLIKRKLMFENYKDCLFNDKTILSSQQRFKSYNHKVYTEEVNKTALSSHNDKGLQTFDRVTTYPYETTSEMLKVFEAKENALKMIKFVDCVNENKTEHNKNWSYITDHPYRILIIGGSGSGKTKCFIEFNRKPTRHR